MGQLSERASYRSGSQPSGRQAGGYVYGNAAQQIDVQREMEQQPRRMPSNATRKNREKARHMNFGYLAFLVLAMCVAGYVLIHYIRLQADITTATEHIASQEKELNNLRVANDEELSRITSGVDMEEVKRVAIGVLGMVYPQEGQIITYSNEGQDYVRKVDEGN
ncbi:MAG: cell division protein FtsL [Lachnospiraceae bacterium]|nr:cell division protein FtsL [Lachnospiraceae bacterium]